MTDCVLCQAKDVQITRLLSRLDTIDHARAKARVVELEETVARLNRTRPQSTAVEVCVELARCDPRDMETLKCQWCGEKASQDGVNGHQSDCAWRQAWVVAEIQAKRETKAVVDRWRAS